MTPSSKPKPRRTLSQTGLSRYQIPANPRQRRIDPTTGAPTRRCALDRINEKLAASRTPRRLYPTKGYRKLSSRATESERITNRLRGGARFSVSLIAERLRALF